MSKNTTDSPGLSTYFRATPSRRRFVAPPPRVISASAKRRIKRLNSVSTWIIALTWFFRYAFIQAREGIPKMEAFVSEGMFAPRFGLAIFSAITLGGCGFFDNSCTNTCPAGYVHGGVDCGCMEKEAKAPKPTQPVVTPGSYSIVRRYYCKDVNDHSDRGSCDITVNSTSCQAAMDGIQKQFSSVPDPCRFCSGVTDNTKYYSGNSEYIQGGACEGWSSLDTGYDYSSIGLTRSVISSSAWYMAASFKYVEENLTQLMRVAFVTPKENSISTCEAECDNNNPYCKSFDVPPKESAALRKLQDVLSGKPQIVRADNLKTMFSITNDPCNRGDTVFSGGLVTNAGDACELTTHTSVTDVSIEVPELLQGDLSVDANGIWASFNGAETRGRLVLSDPDLNEEWGGDIKAVYATRNHVGFSVGSKSCIRVSLQ
jgi:hypothetical protein